MSRFVLTAQLQLQAPTNTAQVVRQIQSQLNNVQVNVQVQGTAQATRQVNQVAQSINAANSAASNLGRTFAISVRRFTALAVATRAVSLFTNTLANATDEAIQFERELVRVSQVTGKTVAQLRDFTKEITSLATGLGVSSTSLIKVGTILAQAGFNAEQTTIALRTLAKTELAPSFEDIGETAEGVVAIFNQFRQGAEALESQLGSINAVAGAFAVEAGDLIGAIRRVGGVFRSSGGDLNELIALFTSVRATTRESAESIATGLRTIFTRIQRPKTIEFLKQYGVELVDLEGKFVGPFEAVKRLSSALAGLEQGDITFIRIAEELGGFRQIGKVIPLIQQFQIAQDALNVAQKGSTSLSADAASAQAALAIRITKVKEEFLALVRSITETSSFQLFANTALNLASALIKLADALKPIIPLLTAVATIKLAQGVSGFIGGFGRGIGSGRTFNQGGRVLKFARGGMVPGSGNRDTVPAMLQPGEFVIRKSSVNKLGAGNLAAMNENGYAKGGPVLASSLPSVAVQKRVKSANSKEAQENPELFKRGYYLTNTDKLTFNKKEYGLEAPNNIGNSIFEDKVLQVIGGKKPASKIAPVDIIGSDKGNIEVRNRLRTTKDNVLLDKFLRQRILTNKPLIKNQTKGENLKFPDTVSVVYNTGKVSRNRFEQLNLGGLIKKFAFGGKARNFGIAALEGSPITKSVELSINDIANKLPSKQPQNNNLIRGILGAKGVNSISITGQSDLMQLSDPGIKDTIYNTIKNNVYGLINQSAQSLSQATNVPLANRKVLINPNKILNKIGTDSVIGSIFEGALAFLGGPFVSGKSTAAIDFPRGLGNLSSAFANLNNMPVDAKKTSNTENINKLLNTKAPNYFADFIKRDPRYKQLISQKQSTNFAKLKGREFDLTTFQRITGNQKATIKDIEDLDVISRKSGNRTLFTLKNLGGIIQKFAKGGMAQPLIDDIVNATGTMMPRPSSAIAALISAGGGAIDIDRTLKRTIGDKAYGSAKTSGQQSAALDKFFRDPQARLRDVKSAPLTQFGKELQAAIKSGQLQPGKLSIVSKSVRVPGIAEYLSQLFGIPLGNMIFTQGGSKQPAMDALRSKGPRASRVARFAAGGGVGTDTVPALLTPGEFVINKKSAQAIGYGSLNRMNKVGKYAKGGVVQHFAAGGSVTGRSVKSAVQSDTSAITQQIATTSQEIAQTGKQIKNLGVSINKQASVTDNLYKDSANLDAQIKKYDQELIRLAQQQGKAAATGKAANRIVDLKIKAEQQRIDLDNKALAQEQTLTKMKEKQSQLIDQQNKQLAQKDVLIQQARQIKQSSTQQVQSNLVGGAQSTFSSSAQDFANAKAQKQAERNSRKRAAGNKYGRMSGLAGGGSSGMPTSGKDLGMMAVGFTSVTASLQSMLPPLDENSSAFTKLAHSSLSLVTQIGAAVFALNTFGISLNKQSAMKFLGGGGLGGGGKQSVFNFARNLGISKNMSGTITGVVNGLTKLAGPLLAVVGASLAAASAFRTIYDSIYDFDNRLKKSIEKGNVEEAKRVAEEKAAANNNLASGKNLGTLAASTATGAIAGSFIPIPVIGTVIGGLIGLGVGLAVAASGMTTTSESAIALAASQAGAVAAQNALNKAQNVATDSMDRFNKGTLSAAEALAEIRNATKEVEVQEKRASDFATKNLQNRSEFGRGAALRNIGALGGLNPFMETSWARNTRLGEESAGQIKEASRLEAERFKLESPARQAAVRSAAARGIDIEATKQEQTGGLRARANELAELASTLRDAGDKDGAEAAQEASNQLANQVNLTNKEIENMYNEVKRAREAFDAMNLGLRSATATATGASATLTRFANSLQVGGSTLVSDVEFLSTAMTSAAQAMNPDDIRSAINNVAGTLEKFGVSEKFVDKFKSNTETFVKAQQNYASSVKAVIEKNKAAGTTNVSPEKFQDQIAEELTRGLDKEAADNLKKVIGNIKLDQSEIDEFFRTGDVSAFGDKLSEATKKQFEEITKIAQELQKAESVLIDLTKKRIDAERNLFQAQKEAIDLYMEGRDIQASAGGPAVTYQERRGAILRKANVELTGAGLVDIGQGNAADFRAINNQMLNRTAEFQTKASTEGGLQGVEGTKAAEQQANLQKAYKSQIETVRALIKLEQDELKLIKEKNSLEKSSIDALISGDIDKFFEQQAAVGAQAAIATGSSTLQNAFGASALGAAAQETRRLQESGVQELYGQRLAGPGGLTERAFGSALGAMGVDNQRMARVAAGTTAEENAANARLRELGGTLGELGGVGEAMAAMEVASASINVQNAEIKLQDVIDRGNAAAERADGMYRGGVVYANRGMFVPRGTDTVPAMLTPGEFVVRRQAVQRGNNLQILQAMNRGGATQSSASGSIGMANGGPVRYRQNGSNGPESGGVGFGISPEIINRLSQSLDKFNTDLSSNIDKLNNTTFNVKLDSTNINVNLTGTAFLSKLTEDLKSDLYKFVGQEIQNYGVDNGGKLKRKSGPIA